MDKIPITKKLIAFGSKKIYLPRFTIALVRTPDLSPYYARFQVPLDFSKYDLRDYLYHAYNVKCFNIRSFVKQMPIRDSYTQPRHWFRPESKKYMTVEMEQPFVWPETPDLEPWGKKEREEEIKESLSANAPGAEEQREDARTLREQVELLYKRVPEPIDEIVERKLKEGLALTEAERKREDARIAREAAAKERSRMALWEEKRTAKVVEADDNNQYIIKA